MFIGGPNQRKDYHIEEGEEVGERERINCFFHSWYLAVVLSSEGSYVSQGSRKKCPQRHPNCRGRGMNTPSLSLSLTHSLSLVSLSRSTSTPVGSLTLLRDMGGQLEW